MDLRHNKLRTAFHYYPFGTKYRSWRRLRLPLIFFSQLVIMGLMASWVLAAESIPPQMQIPSTVKSKSPAKISNGSAVLNFVDADIKDVLHTVGELTGKNFIIAPGVKGKISVQTSSPVPSKDVFRIFESILEIHGLAAVKTGAYYKILASSSAKQRALEVRGGKASGKVPRGDRVMTQIVPVGFISSKDLVPVLQPMLSSAGSIVNYVPTNTLMITDIASNIKRALTIIEELDVDLFKRMSISIIPLANTEVSTLYNELSNILQSLGLDKGAGQISVIPIERLNSLVVITSNDQLLATAKDWVGRLDSAVAQSSSESMHIYYVQNDKASNIKEILDEIIGVKAAVPSTSTTKTTNAPTKADNYKGYSGDVQIFLFEPQNALITHASQSDYRNLLKMMKELDRPPKQVQIDALVVEVDLDDTLNYGIQWSVLTGNTNIQQLSSKGTLDAPGGIITSPAGSEISAGLTLLATDASKFFGVVKALASDGKVNILSNPHVVVQNYEKATISVGVDEPIATQSTQTATTGIGGLIQEIEYRNTGTILTVTPQITAGGMITMTIRQEVSEAGASRTVGSGDFPSFTKTEAETSVIVEDGETLVIGGLIKEKDDIRHSGIPLLKSIPILGHLFRSNSIATKKIEIVIIITPKIIGYSEKSVTVIDEFKDKLKGFKELLRRRIDIN